MDVYLDFCTSTSCRISAHRYTENVDPSPLLASVLPFNGSRRSNLSTAASRCNRGTTDTATPLIPAGPSHDGGPTPISRRVRRIRRGLIGASASLSGGMETAKNWLRNKVQRGGLMSSGVISLTFDDGLQSTFEHAAPILARYSMPATVGLICDRLLWRRIPVAMSLENARTLAASGWEMASHSLFHRRMEKLPPTYADEAGPDGGRAARQCLQRRALGRMLARWSRIRLYLPRCRRLDVAGERRNGLLSRSGAEADLCRVRKSRPISTSRLKLGSMERELKESRAVLEDLGFDIQSFIVPFSLWREEWERIGRRHYRFIASVSNRVNHARAAAAC